MRTISIRLDERTDTLLAAYCERHGVTQTGALKAAIEQLARAPAPSPADLAEQMGLIGAFRSAEGDLAAQHSARIKERLRAKGHSESMAVPTPRRSPAPKTR
ncbi:hypothetical protein HLB44_18030 [Aquincola sp. S2]|uniref:CopG family transcriptional regulator n=1 Tax=Pseudaquabacterium terrae TaxID=2732868 RepID=A0ABX2EJQ2_9BURK|nr:hypothetical protein [Aquabacterium terrae]NRF68895.1 hypothetical protein [Aquabacterium terrae]